MKKIDLDTISTNPPANAEKEKFKKKLEKLHEELYELQHLFYACRNKSFLIIFQGIDTAGKDSTIGSVFSHMNPLGVQGTAFRKPTETELRHDYMWRVVQKLPEKGTIGIFNRSYYEDILIPTINKTTPKNVIEKRYEYINAFEAHLQNSDTLLLKFYLHISRAEQKKRIRERLEDPIKRWKYSKEDGEAAKQWNEYRKTYERILNQCNTAPWHIIPADHKWYRNYVVAETIVNQLRGLKMKYPKKGS